VKITNDAEVRRGTKAFAEKVEDHWKQIAPSPGDPDHLYATGGYKASIQNVQNREPATGRFTFGWKVFTIHPNAIFLEYGTRPDKKRPNFARYQRHDGTWGRSPNTPTPAFAYAARTALRFGGTAP